MTQLTARSDMIVFAGARDPAVYVVKLRAAGEGDANVETIKKVVGRLDVMIAIAGMKNGYQPGTEGLFGRHGGALRGSGNALDPLVLFQAADSLLKKSYNPKFVLVSTSARSVELGTKLSMPIMCYGSTKAAVNLIAAKLWHENPQIAVLLLHPGFVRTLLGIFIPVRSQLKSFELISPDQSVAALLKLIGSGIIKERCVWAVREQR
ncbi:hypothetical protein DACRYDRAFT_104375 [Dacryopinax primogenitus]|uniref:NADP-binding protein n=1 Tax=Dacryopinax primogenitus (strain DJM 731) TaxID=1858805 RepID=M5GBS2_DACPD|nr:uncharacterized protein DACRYDRAFT_104375 [Dacryopinax primogenitus]EJU05885.1 hypothetical protein DACRYDRAFT_104375 [Dacryopinax primogenitus]